MHRIAMTAAAAAFFGGGAVASAADLSFKDTPYSLAPAPVWSGLYVGGHLGALWSSDRETDASKKWCKSGGKENGKWVCKEWNYKETDKVTFDNNDDDVSFIGGLHVGYNWQHEATVLGIEADVDFADEIDYLATLRARLGYAAGNVLIYATAGVAFAGLDDEALNFKIKNSFGGDSKAYSFDSDDDGQVGFVAGGGIEYKLRSNWSVGLEGLYYNFGDDSNSYDVKRGYKTYEITEEDDNDFWTVRARLTYHFSGEASEAPLK